MKKNILYILGTIICGIMLLSACKKDDDSSKSKQGTPSGIISFNFEGQAYSFDVSGIEIPFTYECEGNSRYCFIGASGEIGNLGVVVRIAKMQTGQFTGPGANGEQPMDIYFAEKKEDQTFPEILFSFPDECEINITNFSGYKPKILDDNGSRYYGNLDRLTATFSATNSYTGKSITDGYIDISYK